MILRYELRTHHPTKTGNHYVIVDDDGAVRAHQNAKDPPPGRDWTVEPDAAKVGQLADARALIERILGKAGFFAMPVRRESPATQGGIERTLDYVGADGAARTVTVDRTAAPDFDKLIKKLLDALGVAEIPVR